MSAQGLRVALVGNPNCGKTALFNLLTGSRQKVANYEGVTVERREGRMPCSSVTRLLHILDLPGAYSLDAVNQSEKVTCDVLQGNYPGEGVPDLVVFVADATNLRLHLRFLLEVRSLGCPIVVALNMMDAARRRGIVIDVTELSRRLGLPIVETVAVRRDGAHALVRLLDGQWPKSPQETAIHDVTGTHDLHTRVRELLATTVKIPSVTSKFDEIMDHWVLHPVFGLLILTALMFQIFQAVYSVSLPMTDAIGDGFDFLGSHLASWLPPGPLRSLLVDGIFAGLGTVCGFLPNILALFLFIMILEDSGYLPRAAFLLDRLMLSVGLTGRSFIPMLSSFACAIPGIMGTRSITDQRERLATILTAPLMTCSARLPIYTLLIGAFIPADTVMGVFNLQGIVLFAFYFAGIVGAMLIGWVFKRIRPDKTEHTLIMELPSYRLPRVSDVLICLYERSILFLKRLTGIILAATILIWALVSFPKPPSGMPGPAINYSMAGYIGHAFSYFFMPIGFDWQISLALIPAFMAREIAVSSLATVYSVGGGFDLGQALATHMQLPAALSIMAWFAYAPQCMSTLMVIRRETDSWRNAMIWFSYSFAMAYVASLLTFQIAKVLL